MSSTAAARPAISVVVPVFNEREVLPELYRRLTAVMARLAVNCELILVNDGSGDGSWEVVQSLALADPRVKAIGLSRNFGHQPALTAGLHAAQGDAVVFMDADLQDPPELIPQLHAKHLEGYDVVYAQRRARDGETLWKRATARAFYRVMRKMTALDMPVDTGDFRLISRRVADDLCRLREYNPFMRGLVTWVGYRQTGVPYDREPRFKGHTKFSTARMISFALDGITSFSSRPLRLAAHAGVFFAGMSLVLMLVLIAYRLSGGTHLVQGWTSLIVAVLLLGGLNLIAIGLLGEYIGRIYDQVKGRPLYLVKDRLNVDDAPRPDVDRGVQDHAVTGR
jgi:glycosyltransferase involved in cell wall biosynthesis